MVIVQRLVQARETSRSAGAMRQAREFRGEAVRALLRQFVPRPDDGSFFAERMTVRLSASAPINDPRSLFRPNLKIIHRADPGVTVSIGAQRLIDSS